MTIEVEYDIPRATAAVQFLVDDPYAVARYKALRKAITQPRRLPYKDDAEVLNELIKIGRQSPVALEKLIAVVEFKRNYNDTSYMATFMAESRRRVKEALFVQQTIAGVTFTHTERYAAERKIKELWAAEKHSFMEEAQLEYSAVTGEEKLPHEQKLELSKAFWIKVDAELIGMRERAIELRGAADAPKKYKVTIDKKVPDSEIARKLNKAYAEAEKIKQGK